jgi:hypothetical protein
MLFVPKGGQRIHPAGTDRRYAGRQDRDTQHQPGTGSQHGGRYGRSGGKNRAQHPSCGNGDPRTRHRPGVHQQAYFARHHRQNGSVTRAKGNADANLAGTPGHRISENAVDADRGESHGQYPEYAGNIGDHPLVRK